MKKHAKNVHKKILKPFFLGDDASCRPAVSLLLAAAWPGAGATFADSFLGEVGEGVVTTTSSCSSGNRSVEDSLHSSLVASSDESFPKRIRSELAVDEEETSWMYSSHAGLCDRNKIAIITKLHITLEPPEIGVLGENPSSLA